MKKFAYFAWAFFYVWLYANLSFTLECQSVKMNWSIRQLVIQAIFPSENWKIKKLEEKKERKTWH